MGILDTMKMMMDYSWRREEEVKKELQKRGTLHSGKKKEIFQKINYFWFKKIDHFPTKNFLRHEKSI